MFKISTNAKSFDLLQKFTKDFKQNIIVNGLDATLSHSLNELKKDLNFFINNNVRNAPSKLQEKLKKNEFGQEPLNPPKSERDILHYFTNGKVDLEKYDTSKSFTDLQETGLLVGHYSKNQESANRITLRMNIGDSDTVESHHAAARQFINSAVFALPDERGKINYYVNPGIDLTEQIKIKCSVFTGFGDTKPKKGMSPAERFKRDSQTKGYAEWTLKQEAVDKIRNNFINITPVMESIKEGNFDEAEQIAKTFDKKQQTLIASKINDLKTNTNIPKSMIDYKNIIDTINTLKWFKKVIENRTEYVLGSTATPVQEEDLKEHLFSLTKRWAAIERKGWLNALKKKLYRLIGKYS